MGKMTIWQQICEWARHPLSNLGALIAFRYCERNDLEIHFRWRRLDTDTGTSP